MAKLETIHGNGNYFLFHLLNFLFDLRNNLLGLSLGTIYRICQNYQIQFYQFPNKNLCNEIKRLGGSGRGLSHWQLSFITCQLTFHYLEAIQN